jgi:hypothetical protein
MREIPFAQLPATLRDAVLVCRKTGFEYLWVDAFCILQDDAADQMSEIAKMPYVYGGAVFTIAASRCRSVDQRFLATRSFGANPPPAFTLPYRCRDGAMGAVTIVRLDLSPEPIDSRGWTFQERLLSPRTIEYGTWQTRWLCQESGFDPKYTDGWKRKVEDSSVRKDTLHLLTPHTAVERGHPRFDYYFTSNWQSVVRAFTGRHLTKPTDRPLAILGIAARFASSLDEGDYVAGLWKPYMQLDLFWYIEQGGAVARPVAFQGPSWSWTAVNGPVVHPYVSWYLYTPGEAALDILSYPGDAVGSHAPSGASHPTSDTLRVRGRLAAGCTSPPDAKGVKKVRMLGVDITEFGGTGLADMFLDTTELDEEGTATGGQAEQPVALLQVLHGMRGGKWNCCGLVLRPAEYDESGGGTAEGSVFRRVGAFLFNESQFEGTRPKEENRRDWERRMDLQLDWFNRITPREFEII